MDKKLIKIGAPWCGNCKIVEKQLIKVSEEGFKVVDLNIELPESEEFLKTLKEVPPIKNLPTVLIVKDDTVVKTMIGVHKSQDYLKELNN